MVATISRQLRKNEVNEKDYYFISDEEFKKIISDGGFLEWAKIGNFYYGIELKSCFSGPNFINIDYQGMVQVKEKYPGSIAFFIKPPSMVILKNCLMKRAEKTEMTDGEIKKRPISAKE